jgi:cell volume regulation protein A
LIGAITSSTDAAAVFALLRAKGIRLKEKLSPTLELESGSNDPMAVFLTISLIQLIQNPDQPLWSLVGLFFQQMILGGLMGILFGKLLLYMINRLRLGYEGLYPVLALGIVLLAFGVTVIIGGSPFLAVYVAGLTLAQTDFLHKRSLIRFYEGLAWLFQIVMFLALGLFVFPSRVVSVFVPGMLLAIILMFVARPLSVWLCMIPFRMPSKEKNFIAWVGLRGAVPIILATYPRLAGIEQSDLIFNVIFFVVLTSLLIQGTTISTAARLLKVNDPNKPKPSYPLEVDPLQGWKGELREIVIPENSCVVGKAIFELGLPGDYLIVLLARDDEFIIPNGSLIFQEGDRLLGLADDESHQTVLTQFNTLTC